MNHAVSSTSRGSTSAVLIAILVLAAWSQTNAAVGWLVLPDPVVDSPLATKKGRQTTVLAGGCFCTPAPVLRARGLDRVNWNSESWAIAAGMPNRWFHAGEYILYGIEREMKNWLQLRFSRIVPVYSESENVGNSDSCRG